MFVRDFIREMTLGGGGTYRGEGGGSETVFRGGSPCEVLPPPPLFCPPPLAFSGRPCRSLSQRSCRLPRDKRQLRPFSSGKNRKDTKEYLKFLNQKGTKIKVFRVRFRAPLLPAFFPHFPPSFPLQAPFTLPPLLPSSPPPLPPPPFLSSGNLRFRYPSDLGTL